MASGAQAVYNTRMLTVLTPLQVEVLTPQIAAVYHAAFSGPPYFKAPRETDSFRAWLPQHVLRPAFRFVAVFDDRTAVLAGFAYGYRTTPGQYWYEQVSRTLGSERAAHWLGDAFQLCEIAVAPQHQGRGFGGALHDAALGLAGAAPGPLPCRRAVLSTLAAETVALGMYRRKGWETLLETFTFPEVARVYRIMGWAAPAAHSPRTRASG